jgi:hypothetical protein
VNPITRDTLARWVRGGCHGIVTRGGEEDACGKPVVGVIADPVDGHWPACTYHLHRWGRGRVVPLADLLATWRTDD